MHLKIVSVIQRLREYLLKIKILMNNTLFIFNNRKNNVNSPKCWLISFLKISFSVFVFNHYQPFVESHLILDMSFEKTYAALFLHTLSLLKREEHKFKKCSALNRVGPHNIDILSIIFGSLLGKGDIEKKKDGSRIIFYQEAVHVKYSLLLHNKLQTLAYCKPSLPQISKKLGKKGKIYRTIRFVTLTYTSFDWIYDLWYLKGIKVVPQSISDYLTPLALAIWVMDSGVKSSRGLNFISCFSYSDSLLIVQVLQQNFGLKARIQPTGIPSQHNVYIPKESVNDLRKIVSAFIIPAMKYKLLS